MLSAYTEASAGTVGSPKRSSDGEPLGAAGAGCGAAQAVAHRPPQPEQHDRRGAVVAEQQAAGALVRAPTTSTSDPATVISTLVSEAIA